MEERAPDAPTGPSERPYSAQAEEGSHRATPDEWPPFDIVPDGDTLGTVHVHEALKDLVFPMTRAQLMERAGAWRIPVTGASFRPLREYLDNVEEERFRNVDEVVRAITKAWHKHHGRERLSGWL